MSEMKFYKMTLTTLSPIHIGASRDLEPTNYVIYAPTSQNNAPAYLYTFTPKQLAESLCAPDKDRLLSLSKKNDNLMELQNFFKDKAPFIAKNANKRALLADECYRQYVDKFGKKNSRDNEFNQFLIEQTIFDEASQRAYIPGSSIKGAIRTALLSAKNKEKPLCKAKYIDEANTRHPRIKRTDPEKDLYHYTNPTNDPFKELKIADALSETVFQTHILKAVNWGRNSNNPLDIDDKGIQTFMEVIPEGRKFTSSIGIVHLKENGSCFSLDNIRIACNAFFQNRLKEICSPSLRNALQKKIDDTLGKSENAFLIRLGKHGGAENVTIDDDKLRHIKIMHKNKKSKGSDKNHSSAKDKEQPPVSFEAHGTTYWTAQTDEEEDALFGWAVITFEQVK